MKEAKEKTVFCALGVGHGQQVLRDGDRYVVKFESHYQQSSLLVLVKLTLKKF